MSAYLIWEMGGSRDQMKLFPIDTFNNSHVFNPTSTSICSVIEFPHSWGIPWASLALYLYAKKVFLLFFIITTSPPVFNF